MWLQHIDYMPLRTSLRLRTNYYFVVCVSTSSTVSTPTSVVRDVGVDLVAVARRFLVILGAFLVFLVPHTGPSTSMISSDSHKERFRRADGLTGLWFEAEGVAETISAAGAVDGNDRSEFSIEVDPANGPFPLGLPSRTLTTSGSLNLRTGISSAKFRSSHQNGWKSVL